MGSITKLQSPTSFRTTPLRTRRERILIRPEDVTSLFELPDDTDSQLDRFSLGVPSRGCSVESVAAREIPETVIKWHKGRVRERENRAPCILEETVAEDVAASEDTVDDDSCDENLNVKDEQAYLLRKYYSMIPYMDEEDLERVESDVGLSSRKIIQWHQHQEQELLTKESAPECDDVKPTEILKDDQVCLLRQYFSIIPFMDSEDLEKLESTVGLSKEQILNWHQHQEQERLSKESAPEDDVRSSEILKDDRVCLHQNQEQELLTRNSVQEDDDVRPSEVLEDDQECELRKDYSIIPFMDPEDLEKLESTVGLTSKQIIQWHQQQEHERLIKKPAPDGDVKSSEIPTDDSVWELKKHYSMIPFMDSEDLEKLESTVGLTSEQIQQWHKDQEQQVEIHKTLDEILDAICHPDQLIQQATCLESFDEPPSEDFISGSAKFLDDEDVPLLDRFSLGQPSRDSEESDPESASEESDVQTSEILKDDQVCLHQHQKQERLTKESTPEYDDVGSSEILKDNQESELRKYYSMIPFMDPEDLEKLESSVGLSKVQIIQWRHHQEQELLTKESTPEEDDVRSSEILNDHQVRLLRQYYSMILFMDPEDLKKLEFAVGLTSEQIIQWHHDRKRNLENEGSEFALLDDSDPKVQACELRKHYSMIPFMDSEDLEKLESTVGLTREQIIQWHQHQEQERLTIESTAEDDDVRSSKILKDKQVCLFRQHYSMIPFMDPEDLEKLEFSVGLTQEQIIQWHQNQEQDRLMKESTPKDDDVKSSKILKDDQERELRKYYSMIPFMDSEDLEKLESSVGLSMEQIIQWHQDQVQERLSKESAPEVEDVRPSETLASVQKCELRKYYSMIPFMDPEDLEKLESTVGLTRAQIIQWHQHQEQDRLTENSASEYDDVRSSGIPMDDPVWELKKHYSMIPFMDSEDLEKLESSVGLTKEQILKWHEAQEQQSAKGSRKRGSSVESPEAVFADSEKPMTKKLRFVTSSEFEDVQSQSQMRISTSSESSESSLNTSLDSNSHQATIEALEAKNRVLEAEVLVSNLKAAHYQQILAVKEAEIRGLRDSGAFLLKTSEFERLEEENYRMQMSIEHLVREIEELKENLENSGDKNRLVEHLEEENRRLQTDLMGSEFVYGLQLKIRNQASEISDYDETMKKMNVWRVADRERIQKLTLENQGFRSTTEMLNARIVKFQTDHKSLMGEKEKYIEKLEARLRQKDQQMMGVGNLREVMEILKRRMVRSYQLRQKMQNRVFGNGGDNKKKNPPPRLQLLSFAADEKHLQPLIHGGSRPKMSTKTQIQKVSESKEKRSKSQKITLPTVSVSSTSRRKPKANFLDSRNSGIPNPRTPDGVDRVAPEAEIPNPDDQDVQLPEIQNLELQNPEDVGSEEEEPSQE